MNAKHISEYALEESIQQGISYYFRTNPTNVYDALLGYIEKGYGIFHCEGDEAVLEDITELLEKKGVKVSDGVCGG